MMYKYALLDTASKNPVFLRFLKERDAYRQFFNNVLKYGSKVEAENIKPVDHTYIFTGFGWPSSSEGYNFWRDLDTDWAQHCSHYRRPITPDEYTEEN